MCLNMCLYKTLQCRKCIEAKFFVKVLISIITFKKKNLIYFSEEFNDDIQVS